MAGKRAMSSYSGRYAKKSRGMFRARLRRRPLKRKSVVRNRNRVAVGLGFPKKMTMTHKYCEQVAFNTQIGGALATYVFSANGMYDPNVSGTGHQPYYFDQMSALYDQYTVIGSKIKVRVSKSDGTSNVPITCGIYIDDNGATSTTITSLLEQSTSSHKTIIGGNPSATLIKKWGAKKFFGGAVLNNSNFQGTASLNPAEQSYFFIYVDSSVNATQTNVTLDVEIEYIAVWTELRDIAGS